MYCWFILTAVTLLNCKDVARRTWVEDSVVIWCLGGVQGSLWWATFASMEETGT